MNNVDFACAADTERLASGQNLPNVIVRVVHHTITIAVSSPRPAADTDIQKVWTPGISVLLTLYELLIFEVGYDRRLAKLRDDAGHVPTHAWLRAPRGSARVSDQQAFFLHAVKSLINRGP